MNNNLLSVLSNLNNGSFVGIVTKTAPKMKKTNNPFNGCLVEKVTKQVLQFGYSYENAVSNRAETEFKAEPLKWGEWLIPNKVINHNGKLYARFYKVANTKPVTAYLIDGELATEEQVRTIQQFLPTPSTNNRQAEIGLTENQVQPLNFSFDSILSLKAGEIEYTAQQIEVATALA